MRRPKSENATPALGAPPGAFTKTSRMIKGNEAACAIDYRCARHGSPEARYQWTAAGDARVAAPGSLEFFLLERYALFTTDAAGGIYCGRVHHEPYRCGATEAESLSTEPARLAGFDLKGEPCSLLAAKQVDVQIFKLQGVPA
jgi:hypothetical protein